VPLELDSHQIAAGFDSLWVSERLGNRVVRLDPQTGAVLATIDIGDSPVKLQPADGRMWVRAGERYVAIDTATNTVIATLAKADVGPSAAPRGRSAPPPIWANQPQAASPSPTGHTSTFPTADLLYVAVVDAETNAVTGTIETLGANSVALLDGSLWTASGRWDLVQRFDDV
jgi:DNA-binding beta-propeller fold protein YncE